MRVRRRARKLYCLFLSVVVGATMQDAAGDPARGRPTCARGSRGRGNRLSKRKDAGLHRSRRLRMPPMRAAHGSESRIQVTSQITY